jgi:Flp pilus assembly protein TadD
MILAGSSRAVAAVLAPDEIRLLAEVGMMAANLGQAGDAKAIFEGLRVFRPAESFVYIGLALARMGTGAHMEAARLLQEEGLRARPGDEEILAIMALALSLAGRHAEAGRIATSLLEQPGPASPARRMAEAMASKKSALPVGSMATRTAGAQQQTGQVSVEGRGASHGSRSSSGVAQQ